MWADTRRASTSPTPAMAGPAAPEGSSCAPATVGGTGATPVRPRAATSRSSPSPEPSTVWLSDRDNGGFLVTHTGGRTWSLTRLHRGQAVRPTTVLMQDASQGLVIGRKARAAVFLDERRGATWQLKSAIPNGARDYVELARSGSQLCAVSALGDVATSTDNGATWSNEGLVMGPTMSGVAVRRRRWTDDQRQPRRDDEGPGGGAVAVKRA